LAKTTKVIRKPPRVAVFESMSAESFGNSCTIVEVTPDELGAAKQMWIALAKPNQAVTLVLAEAPEGWTAEVVPAVLNKKQLKLFQRVRLKPGEVYRIDPE
jgi:hypothetical protein